MKANELMIGDWVYGTRIKANAKVVAMDSENQFKDIIGSVRVLCHDISFGTWAQYLEPIPLTAEILIENDFHNGSILEKLNDENTFIKHNCFSFIEGDGLKIAGSEWATKIVEIDFSNGKINLEIIIQSICNVVFDDIHYVHELQHALKLCGIEKDIQL